MNDFALICSGVDQPGFRPSLRTLQVLLPNMRNQFRKHPLKSHIIGIDLLRDFVDCAMQPVFESNAPRHAVEDGAHAVQ